MFRNIYLEKAHGSYVLKSEHSDHAPRYVLERDGLMIRGVVPHMRRELLSPSYTTDCSELLVVKAQ